MTLDDDRDRDESGRYDGSRYGEDAAPHAACAACPFCAGRQLSYCGDASGRDVWICSACGDAFDADDVRDNTVTAGDVVVLLFKWSVPAAVACLLWVLSAVHTPQAMPAAPSPAPAACSSRREW